MKIGNDTLKILTIITKRILEDTFNEHIDEIKSENKYLWNFINDIYLEQQTMLLDGDFGSGKTYTLMALQMSNIKNIKSLILKYCNVSPIKKDKLDKILTMSELSEFISINSLGNLQNYLSAFNNIIFINVESVLHSKDWVKKLYQELLKEILNFHPELIDKINKNKLLPHVEIINLGEKLVCSKDLDEFVNYTREALRKSLQNVELSFSFGPIKLANIDFREKDIEFTTELITELLETINIPSLTFVFENLDRSSGNKIIDFLSQFNVIFQNRYNNKIKFIFTLSKNELLEKINITKNKDTYLDKYFDCEVSLSNFNLTKFKMLESWKVNDKFFFMNFGLQVNENSVEEYLKGKTKILFENEKEFISEILSLPIRKIENLISTNNKFYDLFSRDSREVNIYNEYEIKSKFHTLSNIDKFWNYYMISKSVILELKMYRSNFTRIFQDEKLFGLSGVFDIVRKYFTLSQIKSYYDIEKTPMLEEVNIKFGRDLFEKISNNK